jgi:hypothetical protein
MHPAEPGVLAQEPAINRLVRAAPPPGDVAVVGSLRQLDDAHPCLAGRGSHRTSVATSAAVSRVGIAVGAGSSATVQPRLTGNTAASAIGLICSRIHAAAATAGPARAGSSLRHRLTPAPLAALLAVLRLSALAPVAALAFGASRLAPPRFCRARIVRVGQPQEAERRGQGSQGPAPGASDEQGSGQGIKAGSVHDWCSLGQWPARTRGKPASDAGVKVSLAAVRERKPTPLLLHRSGESGSSPGAPCSVQLSREPVRPSEEHALMF